MMNNKFSKSESTDSDPKGANRNRKGRGAKARAEGRYRDVMNERQWTESRAARTAKYFGDSGDLIEKSLDAMAIRLQPRARPMTVSTRGVGMIAVLEYQKMCSTWNLEQMRAICTIYQFYRTTLYLTYYKVYCGLQSSSEQQSYGVNVRIEINDNIRQIIAPILKIPSATAALLASIGKITTTNGIWHSYLPPLEGLDEEGDAWAWTRILFTHPDNIRATLLNLADEGFAADQREFFRNRNPIPGARWSNDNVLLNADEIWPNNYGHDELQEDVRAFSDLLTRAGSRLPAHFLSDHEWSGVGAKTGTWSADCDSDESKLEAAFEQRGELRAVRRTLRGNLAGGEMQMGPQITYVQDRVVGSNVIDLWTPDGSCTSGSEAAIGAFVKVGQVWKDPPRLQVNGSQFVAVNPYAALCAVIDTPRPPANR